MHIGSSGDEKIYTEYFIWQVVYRITCCIFILANYYCLKNFVANASFRVKMKYYSYTYIKNQNINVLN